MKRYSPNDSLKRPIGLFLAGAAFSVGANALGGEIAENNHTKQDAVEYAEQSGYTDVTVTDVDTFFAGPRGCGSKSDLVKYEMQGTAPNGTEARFIACGGIWKSLTLRQG